MAGEDRRNARSAALGLDEPKQMPSNLDCEQAVLGSLLMHNDAYARVADILTSDCFFEPLHQRIYEAMVALIPQGRTANAITLRSHFGDQDLGGGMTVPQYLARLSTEAALPANIREYATILNDLACRRKMISIAMDLQEKAYNAPVSATAKSIAERAMDSLSVLNVEPGATSDFEAFETVSYRAVMQAQDAYKSGATLSGLSTGLQRLDEALGGLTPSNLIILAGRPAMGKTSLATNICFAVARHLQEQRNAGYRTGVAGFFSLEMSAEELAQRIISEQSGVPTWRIKRGEVSENEMARYVNTQHDLRKLPIEIDKTGELTIGQLQMRARALKKRKGLELLVVDYLQLLKGSGTKKDANRVQELTEITTGLKALAKDLNVPIIALSQLSRRVEEREDKRPMLSDLRESGSIEQDADIVMFVYRDEYYLKKQKPPAENTEARLNYDIAMIRAKGVAEVIIGKHRHAPEGTVELGFDAHVTRFLNEPEERELMPEPIRKEKRKDIRLPKDATTLYGVLKNLTMSHSKKPDPGLLRADKKLSPKAILIPVDDARKAYGTLLYGPEGDKAVIEKSFRDMMKALAGAELALWTGSREDGVFVWVPDLVA